MVSLLWEWVEEGVEGTMEDNHHRAMEIMDRILDVEDRQENEEEEGSAEEDIMMVEDIEAIEGWGGMEMAAAVLVVFIITDLRRLHGNVEMVGVIMVRRMEGIGSEGDHVAAVLIEEEGGIEENVLLNLWFLLLDDLSYV